MNTTKEWQHQQKLVKYPFLTKEWLINQYVTLGKSKNDISKIIGCSVHSVTTSLKYYGIKLRSRKEYTKQMLEKISGENNARWKGGMRNTIMVGKTASLSNHQKIRKKLINERGELCEWCCQTKVELHHIIPYNYDLESSNLLLLCRQCHVAAEWVFRKLACQYFVDNKTPNLYTELDALKQRRSSQNSQD